MTKNIADYCLWGKKGGLEYHKKYGMGGQKESFL